MKKSLGNEYTPLGHERTKELLAKGLTPVEIARLHGVTRQAVYLNSRYQPTGRKRGRKALDTEKIATLRESEYPWRKIAAFMRCSESGAINAYRRWRRGQCA